MLNNVIKRLSTSNPRVLREAQINQLEAIYFFKKEINWRSPYWHKSFELHRQSEVVTLEICKIFDQVSHTALLSKVRSNSLPLQIGTLQFAGFFLDGLLLSLWIYCITPPAHQ